MQLLWNQSYETGNISVDNEHKEIFGLVEKILNEKFESKSEKIKKAIAFLANYTVRHFQNEEKLMEESNYPRTAEHKQQHADFVVTVGELQEKLRIGTEELNLSLIVNEVIVNWLTEHIIGSDKAMAKFYKEFKDAQKKKR
ncbi:MAG: bacteriohemerythrin [Oscillospiraceae bacterium]|nr:bacteriohemerythrin [Oscillospiraceae bacterium]